MVGVACAAPDARDRGGGDVPSPFPEGGVRVLLHLRGGAQYRSGTDLQYSRPVFATVGLLKEEAIIAQAWLLVFDLDIRGPPTA